MARLSLFVSGTDTEVGKTFVATAILNWARRQGWQCIGLKPVAAGCERDGDHWYNDDARRLQAAATVRLSYAEVNLFALPDAIAPHIAAQRRGVMLQAADIAAHCRKFVDRDVDLVVIEGAGGWLVPLNERETFADVAVHLDIPVVLVVAVRLGCLNHALLTARAIQQSGLRLGGWIANCLAGQDSVVEANVATLKHWLQAPCLGVLPPCPTPDQRARVDSSLQLDTLFHSLE